MYTPGIDAVPHPIPQDTKPTKCETESCSHTRGDPPSPCTKCRKIKSYTHIKIKFLILFWCESYVYSLTEHMLKILYDQYV